MHLKDGSGVAFLGENNGLGLWSKDLAFIAFDGVDNAVLIPKEGSVPEDEENKKKDND